MNEVKAILKRMAAYFLLLAINIIPCANIISDSFPTRNLSTIYLLALCSCLILYYSHRVTSSGGLSALTKALSWMALLLILLRGIKYSAFAQVDVLARHTWYLYYVPMLLLPLFLFYISLLVSSGKGYHLSKGWYWTAAVTVVFILLILTNDSHQLVFCFNSNFSDWNNDYSYGILFYVILVWRYTLYIAAVAVLIIKCRVSSSKRNAWIILVPFLIGIVLNLLLITGKMPKLNGAYFTELPEVIVFTAAAVLECCMQLGLIPTNTDYGKLFNKFSISAQITDKGGVPVYTSSMAKPLTAEQFAMQSGSRTDDHTVMRKMAIPGGFGFWQEDMTELDRLNAELNEAKEELSQEAELTRLRNELKEKQTITEQRTKVYDEIAKRTERQSQAISKLAKTARLSLDSAVKESCRNQITLLGAYIKRYANLTLLSQESEVLEIGELGLSVSEVLRYLNFCGTPGEFFNNAECEVSAEAAILAFEAFERLLELNYVSLRGVFVNLSEQDDKVMFKLTLENASRLIPEDESRHLNRSGVMIDESVEDNVAYICFALPKGGEAV